MTRYTNVAIDRDTNRKIISSSEAFKLKSTWTFSELTTGSVGQHTLFAVTGDIVVDAVGVCTSDLTSDGSPTLSVGTAGSVVGILGQQDAVGASGIDTDNIWTVSTLGEQVTSHHDGSGERILGGGADIIINILVDAITGGVINFYLLWRPLSSTANVLVVTPA